MSDSVKMPVLRAVAQVTNIGRDMTLEEYVNFLGELISKLKEMYEWAREELERELPDV